MLEWVEQKMERLETGHCARKVPERSGSIRKASDGPMEMAMHSGKVETRESHDYFPVIPR